VIVIIDLKMQANYQHIIMHDYDKMVFLIH